MTALGGGYERKPEEKKRLIVNEQGKFVRPSDLQKTMGGPLFSPYSEEEEQEFLFDDDLDWRTPVNALPVQRKAGSRPPVPKDGPKRRTAPARLGILLTLTGGLSNQYDRLRRGSVTDYVRFPGAGKKLRSLVWNLADFMLLGGTVLTAIGLLRELIKGK